MSAVSILHNFLNAFKGTLPESGIRTMTAMASFGICFNDFTGVLLAGTLPNRALAGLGALSVNNNDFEGKMSQH
eukprot:2768611-Amphidinium_carterae.1